MAQRISEQILEYLTIGNNIFTPQTTYNLSVTVSALITANLNLNNDLNLYTSSADSPDIVWWYADKGKEQARIWMGSGGTTSFGPNYRCYSSDGTSLYNGKLVYGNSIGSATQPIYTDSTGKATATTYSLSATVNSGTQNQVAYYSGANAISSKAPAWAAWTAGSTAGPKANIQIGNATYTSDAIPAAGAGASGIVTTGAQQFDGNKTFKGNIIPQADNTYTIGTTSLRWKQGFFDTTGLLIGAKDVALSSTTASIVGITNTTITINNSAAGDGTAFRLMGQNRQYANLYIATIGKAPTATTDPDTQETTYSGAVLGITRLTIGNSDVYANTASGVDKNSEGHIRLYSSNSKYAEIRPHTISGNHVYYLPRLNTSTSTYYGKLVGIYKSTSAGDSGFSDVGSTTKGVYVTADGKVTAMSYELKADVNYEVGAKVNAGTKWGVAYYSTTTNLTSTAAGTTSQFLGGAGSAAPTWRDASYILNTLSTGSSTPVDADYYISQYVNGGTTTTTYHRRPMSALWTYIDGKITANRQASGTANQLAYYSTASKISGTPNITRADYSITITDAAGAKSPGFNIVGTQQNIALLIGSGNVNRGLYDSKNGGWLLYWNADKKGFMPLGGLEISGGEFTVPSGSVWAGTNKNTTAERQIGTQSGAGRLYMYSQASASGNRGLYGTNNAGTSASYMEIDQSNRVKIPAPLWCSDYFYTSKWGGTVPSSAPSWGSGALFFKT